jgi:hypothetical protein
MKAFEFQTTVQDGLIHIPDRLKGEVARDIKVIILNIENEEKQSVPFPYFGVDTKEFVFNRREANER